MAILGKLLFSGAAVADWEIAAPVCEEPELGRFATLPDALDAATWEPDEYAGDGAFEACTRPELESRRSRFRSARISAACW